jgi:ribosomal protein L23
MFNIKDNTAGLEFCIFDRFFLSEKSMKLQENGIVSFFVKKDVTKTHICNAINMISGMDNCLSVRCLNVKPRSHASRNKRGRIIQKIHGAAVHEKRKKAYVTLRDIAAFMGGFNK